MTPDTAAELEQFFWYLKWYASGEQEALSKALKAGQADALKASDILPDLKKWEGNFKKNNRVNQSQHRSQQQQVA